MRNSSDSAKAAIAQNVSRETFSRLETIADLLTKWQKTINLVSPATIPELWTRHIADSLQLMTHVRDDVRAWVDLGSGGGFPGLVVAAVLAEREGAHVDLVESDSRKSAFLREAARLADLPVSVHPQRIEQVAAALAPGKQVVSARALAPLPKLLGLTAPFFDAGAIGIFPKGKDWQRELTEARKDWTLDLELRDSLSDPHGKILVVTRALKAVPSPAVPGGHIRGSAHD
ncbi:MAG: 16S rRNA (guanine(527)-N(7))-methyltransferase RsmG [Rhizobiales bacterium 32-66-11]|nr:MAG: 16S rRNA (guanine(527)-N(7))-methyltransferase RsmG [Rhizobiales bacterium 32-66-11]